MKVFLIILAVLAVIFAVILSLSAEFTIVFDKGWSTKIRVLFIEKDIELSKILSFILFPEKSAEEVKAESEGKKAEKKQVKDSPAEKTEIKISAEVGEKNESSDNNAEEITEAKAEEKKAKPNYIKKIIDKDGIVGIMLLISNLLQTAGKAVTTLIKGLHIYSLYVKMIIGGADAADIGEKYGEICGIYYPIKGFILNSMKVDMYDDYIQPDFIASRSEYEFQLIVSINVALLLKVLIKAGWVFLVNLIKNK